MKRTIQTQSAGVAPVQDAPEISQSSDKQHSTDLPPHLGATPRTEGGLIQEPPINRGYDPLHYCPTRLRARYGKAAEQAAGGSLIKAIKLKCLDCMGWAYAEAKGCDTRECPLWVFNHRAVPDRKAKERSAT